MESNALRFCLFVSFFIITGMAVMNGQSSSDALRYADPRVLGTARVLGTGSAFGAVGADQGSIGINPAGLALFRKSDLSFGLFHDNLTGEYILEGASNPSSGPLQERRTNLANLGIVFASRPSWGNWVTSNFYIGYNNTASFQQYVEYGGVSDGSILHRFLENARDPSFQDGRGLPSDQLDEFESKLAYETGALFDISNDSTRIFYSNDLIEHLHENIPKSGVYQQSGRQSNLSLSYAANYREKLMIGISLDFISANFRIDKQYSEYSGNQSLSPFVDLQFSDFLTTDVNGIKGNLGLIYKPFNSLRLGLSWHTPSLLRMQDKFNTSLTYRFMGPSSIERYSSSSPDGIFDYRLIIPSRWIFSAAFIKSFGLLSIDLDYFSPNQTRFKFTDGVDLDYQDQLNADIQKQYKSVIQTRLGLEIPIGHLRLRAGSGFIPSPYKNDNEVRNSWSGGLGYRGHSFYLDLGYTTMRYKEALVPFSTGNSDFNNDGQPDAVESVVQSKLHQQHWILTMGFRF